MGSDDQFQTPRLNDAVKLLSGISEDMKRNPKAPDPYPEPVIGEGHVACPFCQGTIVIAAMNQPMGGDLVAQITLRLIPFAEAWSIGEEGLN